MKGCELRVVMYLCAAAEHEQGQEETHLGHPTDAGRMGVGGDQNTVEAQYMRQSQPCFTLWPTHATWRGLLCECVSVSVCVACLFELELKNRL